MKKLLTTLIVLLGLTNTVHAQYRIFDSGQVGSNPQANYYLKTDGVNSTWAAVSAGGGGADGNWVFFNGSGIRLATTTNQLAIGNTATTSDSVVEITKTSAGNIIDLLMLKNTSLTAGTETGIFFGPSNVADKTRGARYSAYNDGSNNVGFKWYTGQGSAIDEKMRLTGAGLLGVGTSTPLAVLSVASANKTTAVPLFVVASSSSAVGTSTYLLVDKNGTIFLGTDPGFLNGAVYTNGLASTPTRVMITQAVNDLQSNLVIGNTYKNSDGTSAVGGITFVNGSSTVGANFQQSTNYCYLGLAGPYFSLFSGLPAKGFVQNCTDGPQIFGATSPTTTLGFMAWAIGSGYSASNYDMVLKNIDSTGIADGSGGGLGIGTTTPFAKLSVVASSTNPRPKFIIASSTNSAATQDTVFIVGSNGRVGIGTSTPGANLSIGNTGSNTVNISATATSTFGSGINVLTGCFAVNGTCVGGGSGSGTVGSGTTGQVPYYAGAGTTLTATSTVFIDTTSFVGINKTSPTERLHISGQNAFSASASTSIFIEQPAGTVGAKNKIVTGVTNGTDPYFAIETRQTGSPFGVVERLRIEGTNGYIGVGTSTPLGLIDLTGSSNSSSVSTFVGGRTLSLVNTDTTNNNGNTLAFRTNDANGLLTTASAVMGRYTSHSAGAVSGQILFNTNNAGTYAQRGVIDSNGYFGLGTTTPGGRVAIVGTTSDPYLILDNNAGQIVSGESLHKIYFTESDEFSSLNDRTSAVIETVATADHAGVGNSTGLRFSTGFSGTPVERLHLRGDGVVAIASSTPWGQVAINANGAGITGPILSVGSSTQTAFVVSNNARVGIGTSTPGMKLAVNGPIFAIGDTNQGLYLGDPSDSNSRPRIVQNGPSGIATYNSFKDNGTAKFALGYGAAGTTPTGSFFISRTSDFTSPDFLLTPAGTFALGLLGNVGIATSTTPWAKLTVAMASTTPSFVVGTAGSSTPAFYVSSANGNGKVGVATSSPATALDVNGTITQLTVKSCSLGLTTDALGSINGCVTSDQRLKKDITPITQDVTTAILSLNPVTYKWKDTKVKDDKVHSGFVAQEVQKVIPLAVSKTGVDNIGVDSNGVLAYVVKFIQGMYSDFQSLVARVSGLEKRLDEQDKRIKALEQRLELLKTN